jgi:hypothetical protein
MNIMPLEQTKLSYVVTAIIKTDGKMSKVETNILSLNAVLKLYIKMYFKYELYNIRASYKQ